MFLPIQLICFYVPLGMVMIVIENIVDLVREVIHLDVIANIGVVLEVTHVSDQNIEVAGLRIDEVDEADQGHPHLKGNLC